MPLRNYTRLMQQASERALSQSRPPSSRVSGRNPGCSSNRLHGHCYCCCSDYWHLCVCEPKNKKWTRYLKTLTVLSRTIATELCCLYNTAPNSAQTSATLLIAVSFTISSYAGLGKKTSPNYSTVSMKVVVTLTVNDVVVVELAVQWVQLLLVHWKW